MLAILVFDLLYLGLVLRAELDAELLRRRFGEARTEAAAWVPSGPVRRTTARYLVGCA